MDTINNPLLEHVYQRNELLRLDPTKILPWYFPCNVRVLLVTDGGLDYGMDDFGLSAFINCLQNDGRFYARFQISLAHLRSNISVASDGMAASNTGITNRITNFRFDDAASFNPALYDQIWLFGIETNYKFSSYSTRNTNASYPASRLSDAELNILSAFMDSGKGVFATGDHGALGNALCGSVKRVKSMRIWNQPINDDINTVSMTGSNRNDTNQIGDAGTQFSDQSDDIPQTIQPKLYHTRVGFMINELYPHPLLCSSLGKITVMPDHPHEGECREPSTEAEKSEYPTVSGVQTLPEVIATSHVRAGNTATLFTASKHPTVAQVFGGICAYDGHKAGVGRVVTDATWHHFINVNIIGLVEGGGFDDLTAASSPTKHNGFLSTAAGMAHMAKIKEYYVNIAVWIATPALIKCFNNKFIIKLINSDRIMESALFDPNVSFEKIPINIFYSIGTHARDVLGRAASQCHSYQFILDLVLTYVPSFRPRIDPWYQLPPDQKPDPEPPLPWFNPLPIANIMLGTVLVALRQNFMYVEAEEFIKRNKEFDEVLNKYLRVGLEMGLKHYSADIDDYRKFLSVGISELTDRKSY